MKDKKLFYKKLNQLEGIRDKFVPIDNGYLFYSVDPEEVIQLTRVGIIPRANLLKNATYRPNLSMQPITDYLEAEDEYRRYFGPGRITDPAKRIEKIHAREPYFHQIEQTRTLVAEQYESLPIFLYHGSSRIIADKIGINYDVLERVCSSGYLQYDTPPYKIYLSRSLDFVLQHASSYGETNDQKILIQIDTRALLKSRKVYIDPETLDFDSEWGKNFMIVEGLPAESIQKIEVLNMEKYHR